MLVISRKRYERVIIGDDVIVTVVSTDRGAVRIGIAAPRDRVVMREELLTSDQVRAVEARAGVR